MENPIRIIGLLHQPERLHAGLAATRMDGRSVEVRSHFSSDAVLDAHFQ
jgi:hypothetical protein